jgi:adenosylhomocysteine nucleosidase
MVVILTALDLEYSAVRKHLTGVRLHRHQAGTLFEVGRLRGRHVALAVVGAGNDGAATITERAIKEFSPSTVLFVGVAGGLKDELALGDVVVATKVYAYHGGKVEADGFNARPRAWEAPHAVEQLARYVARAGEWREDLPDEPAVVFGPIAAGEVVLNAKHSLLGDQLRSHYNDAVAIEMESAGVAKAGHLNAATPTMTIRGISDHADGAKRKADSAGTQELAARNAAAFACALVAQLKDQDQGTESQGMPTVHNSVSGNASVVMQAGVINGDVRLGG